MIHGICFGCGQQFEGLDGMDAHAACMTPEEARTFRAGSGYADPQRRRRRAERRLWMVS